MTYVYALILTAVAAAVVELMIPEGKLSGTVKGAVGLCLLLALLNPIKEGVAVIRQMADGEISPPWTGEDAPDAENYQDVLRDELAALGEKEVSAWVSDTLRDTFGIAVENHTCTVTMTVEEDGITPAVGHVTVVLSGVAIFENPHAIEAYISERLGCTCAVAVGKKEGT